MAELFRVVKYCNLPRNMCRLGETGDRKKHVWKRAAFWRSKFKKPCPTCACIKEPSPYASKFRPRLHGSHSNLIVWCSNILWCSPSNDLAWDGTERYNHHPTFWTTSPLLAVVAMNLSIRVNLTPTTPVWRPLCSTARRCRPWPPTFCGRCATTPRCSGNHHVVLVKDGNVWKCTMKPRSRHVKTLVGLNYWHIHGNSEYVQNLA